MLVNDREDVNNVQVTGCITYIFASQNSIGAVVKGES